MKQKLDVKVNLPEGKLPEWDLSVAFYKGLNDPEIEADQHSLKNLGKELALYRGLFNEMEPYELSIFLRKYELMIGLAQKLSYFAFLYADTHKTDEAATTFQSKIREIVSSKFQELGFIHFELNSLDTDKMIEIYNHPRLQRWKPWLTRVFVSHWNLGEGASFIIDQKSIVSEAWSRLYDETCAKMKFHVGGKALNESETAKKISSLNPKTRKEALSEMNLVYKNNAHVIAMCYNMILKDKQTDDTLWGLSEPVESSLGENRITKETLLSMVTEVVDSYIPISQRFYKLMARLLKKDTLSYEDRNINPIDIPAKKISWPECVKEVLQAYAEFSMEYMAYGLSIIESGTIDVPMKKGKKSGAYCIKGRVPYIMLNFGGTEGDISTFAHELGHGVHHILTAENGLLNESTPTLLAEVASLWAEKLIFQKQREETAGKEELLALLIDHVQDMINSIHRQVCFYKFEERTHRERSKGELSVARLNQIWREESSRYLGFDIGEDAEYMWMGISHIFDQPYYVYSYAFAGLIVNNLMKTYEEWDEESNFQIKEDFADLFIDMLSNTSNEDFISLLKPFGIDAESPKFWANGLKVISDCIDQIEELAKELSLI